MTTPAADALIKDGGGVPTRPVAGSKPPVEALLAAVMEPRSNKEEGRNTPSSGLMIETSAEQTKPSYLGNVGTNQDGKGLPLVDPADATVVATAATVTKTFPSPGTAINPGEARVVDEEPTAREAAAPTNKGKLCSKNLTPTGAKDDGGAGRIRKGEGDCRGVGFASPANIPEGATYSSDPSFQMECKRTALRELARADMDRVNLERDFLNKDARFNYAKAAHIMIHERWVRSRITSEAACNASKGYFMAEERARQKHVAACRDKQAAEAGVREAAQNSALAQTAMRKATNVFHAAQQQQQQTSKVSKENSTTVGMKAPRTCEISSGGVDSLGKESATKSRERAHSDRNGGVADKTLPSSPTAATSNMITLDYATKATHVGSGGENIGASEQEEGYHPTKVRSPTNTNNALSEEKERQSHVEGLQVQRQIRAHATSQAAEAAAQAAVVAAEVKEACRMARSSNSTPALEIGLEGVVVTSGLAVAARNMIDAIDSAKRASADVDSAKAAFDLPGAVRTEAETAVTHRDAVNNTRPYVAWVNNEVAAQRSLQAQSGELTTFASLAWNAREEARKELYKAGDRISRAARVLKSFSRSDPIDVSRHTRFEPVVEEQRYA